MGNPKKINFDIIYNENFNRFYRNYLIELENILKTKNGIKASKKALEYRNNIISKYWSAFKNNRNDPNSPNDRFSEWLRDHFKQREIDYSRDHIELFFKLKVPELISVFKEGYSNRENSNIIGYSYKEMLVFLAEIFALKKIIKDTELFSSETDTFILNNLNHLKNKVQLPKTPLTKETINIKTSKPSRRKNEDKTVLKISDEFILKTFNAIKNLFDKEQHDNLKTLLYGKSLKSKLNLLEKVEMSPFVGVFRLLKRNKKIEGSNIHLFEWLNHYFYYYNKKIKGYTQININSAKNIIESKSNIYKGIKLNITINGLNSDL